MVKNTWQAKSLLKLNLELRLASQIHITGIYANIGRHVDINM